MKLNITITFPLTGNPGEEYKGTCEDEGKNFTIEQPITKKNTCDYFNVKLEHDSGRFDIPIMVLCGTTPAILKEIENKLPMCYLNANPISSFLFDDYDQFSVPKTKVGYYFIKKGQLRFRNTGIFKALFAILPEIIKMFFVTDGNLPILLDTEWEPDIPKPIRLAVQPSEWEIVF